MFNCLRRLAFSLLVLAVIPFSAAFANEPAILTISGDISQSNRGPSDEQDATMLGAHDISFEKGFAVSRAQLMELEQRTYAGSVPGQAEPVVFRGPLLTDVISLAGAEGSEITVTALDGYGMVMTRSYLDLHEPILAVEAEGTSLAIGDLGPAVTVFPKTDDPELKQEFADRQIWAAFHISVK